ncbi:hypothetical protein [Anaeromyxobacter oryzisoli]|uniref:hypothetical protein n=1 Tax=Anaeromyxobacter oryzisoli TaxID=2925408 RepID=UPI001F599EF0|nr:hypothetical protein [Anaeromyxobacter sp. SG63]
MKRIRILVVAVVIVFARLAFAGGISEGRLEEALKPRPQQPSRAGHEAAPAPETTARAAPGATGKGTPTDARTSAVAKPVTVTYGASLAATALSGTDFLIEPKDAAGFQIAAPSNGIAGQHVTIRVKNTTAGAMGGAVWSPAYKLAPWKQPAAGMSRAIEFVYDGASWLEVSRTPEDVPN